MGQYAIYLRKSRTDKDAELRGEGETLARHEKILLDLAKYQGLTITNIYREIVSGETISARPVMQQLLSDVEQGVYDGVLVVEVERLARGDTIDQGIVSQSFKLSDTKIITPLKTYDPNNEYDEEYFEFGLFMSRREYKTINRRLQSGRLASVKEGKYVGNKPPYGYERVKIKGGKGFTLQPEPEEAEIVKMIYEWYTCEDRIGMSLIARRLNDMNVSPRYADSWVVATIQEVLSSPVYIGMIQWNARKEVKRILNGEVIRSRPRAKTEDITLAQGLHEPLVDTETWNKAQHYRSKNRRPSTPGQVTNPLAGLVVCGKCGRKMSRRLFQHNKKQYLLCPVTSCKNVSVQFEYVEEALMNGLVDIMDGFTLELKKRELQNKPNDNDIIMAKLQKEMEKLKNQASKLHDFLEQGIYTTDVFLERSKLIGERIELIKKEIVKYEKEAEDKKANIQIVDFIPKIKNVLDLYYTIDSAEMKNRLLRTVISKIIYTKEKGGRWHDNPKDFDLEIITIV